MRTAKSKAALMKAAVSGTIATTLLGAGLLFAASPAAAADSTYVAAVNQCRATSSGAAGLRDCLRGIAPQRTPRIARKAAAAPAETRSEVRSDRAGSDRATAESAPEAAPEPAAAPAPADESGIDSDVWAGLRECEASGDYGLNDGSGYYGAYQFDLGTWQELGYDGYPHQASAGTQDEAARLLQSQRGWQPWPACSRKLGLR